jgi:hypothetical protein
MVNSISPIPPAAGAALNTDQATARVPAIQPGSVVEDPSMGAVTVAEIAPYWKATESFSRGPVQVAHAEEAGRNMATIKTELRKIDAAIARFRPELSGSNWDFKLVDGKFEVTGLDTQDARWLENRLNANAALRGAAQSFIDTAAADLETTDSNPARQDFNYATGGMENYTFYKVAEQLADTLSFRSLLSQSDQIFDSERIELPDHDRGMSGLAVAATLLKASNPPIDGPPGPFYTPRYEPKSG